MDSIITQVTKESVGVGVVGGSGSPQGENSYHLNQQLQHHHGSPRSNQNQDNGGGSLEGECGQSSNKQNSLLRQRRIVSDKSSTSSSCSNNKGNDGGGGGRGGGGGNSSGDRDGGRRGDQTPQQQNGGSSNSAINFLRKLLNSCCCCVRKQQGTGGRGKEDSGGKNSGGNQQGQGSQGAWGEGDMFVGGGEVRSVGGSSSSSGGGTDEADSVVGGGAASSVGIGSGSSSGICSGERGGISGYLLPPCLPQDRSRPCMVIDLDETLVHSSFKPISNADFIVPVEIDGVVHQVYVAKRPYVDEFLQKMGELYECVLFTASLAKYADPVADLLDKWGVFRTRLFRDACVFHRGNYVKDLNKLGRSLHRVVIVDNSPASYIFHPDNAVPVASWFDDTSDTELLYLIPFFERLSSVDNVYTVLRNSNHPYNSINKDPNQQSNLSPPQSPLHHLHHQQQPPPPPPPNYNSIIHNLQQPPPPQQSPSVSSSSNQSIHQYNGAQSEDNTEIILSKSQQFSNRNSNDS